MQEIFGISCFIAIAWLLSDRGHPFPWQLVLSGLGLQLLMALLVLKTEAGRWFFQGAQTAFDRLITFSDAGAVFVFGPGFEEHFFAFKVLPTIIFFSAMSAVLFHWGVIQRLVAVMAWVMAKTMRLSGAESLVTAANVFCGQTEAPLLVRAYLPQMTRSEVMTMMTGGMATVAGGVLAAYVGFGISAGHLLSASLMSAPAAVLIAKLMVPERQEPETMGTVRASYESSAATSFEAACNGATEGLKLALNVGAMLIAFIALIDAVNFGVAWLNLQVTGYDINLEQLLGLVFAPMAWLCGIAWQDSTAIGALLGKKMVINEFVAFMGLADLQKDAAVSERTVVISTYALCGFANFSSVAIQIGGIGALVPEQKAQFVAYGMRAMIGGTLACLMTAAVASLLLG